MIYYTTYYYHDRFFFIDNKYYIYIYIRDNRYIYNFKIINNQLILNIMNRINKYNHNLKIKIMYEDKECILNININERNVNLGNIKKFEFIKSTNLLDVNIINTYFEDNIDKLFSNFTIDYYIDNNKFINENELNLKFIKFHWYFCGQFNPQIYFKYLLKKYDTIIDNLKIDVKDDSLNNNNTLLFIDDRYDKSFIFLLKLFLYSLNDKWNITIFTTIEKKELYENDLKKIGVIGKINILQNKFKNSYDYSLLLKDSNFWTKIREENVLLFQYDSFCMGKFNDIFLNYNYIGARWPHNPFNNEIINIGNGGTSFRKSRIMENICKKYSNNSSEDLFFGYYLFKDNLQNCNNEIADLFSFENIFCNNSIYAHQIYNTVKLEDLDNFIYNKLISLK